MEIKIQVEGDKIKSVSKNDTAAGNLNSYICSFSFDGAWKSLIRVAVFIRNDTYYNVPLDNNDSCSVPFDILNSPGSAYVGVFGVDKKKDTSIRISAVPKELTVLRGSFSAESVEPKEGELEFWEQCVKAAQAARDEAERAAENAIGKAPYIGENGNWWIYNGESGAYLDSDVKAAGDKGDSGKDGEDGADGVSVTHSWNGTVLKVTSASGTSEADLKGDKGDKGEQGEQGLQGEKGDKGDKGDQGEKGEAGTTDHAQLTNLGYDNSGHTGFQRAFTEAEQIWFDMIPSICDTAVNAESGLAEEKTAREEKDTEIEATANEALAIAKGANQALTFSSYNAMWSELGFNTLTNDKYRVGQNILIQTLNVPDLWIYEIKDDQDWECLSEDGGSFAGDDTFVELLKTQGTVRIGYYVVAALETQKVDLNEYATKEEVEEQIGDIETALDSIITQQESIIAIQNSLIGGDSV